VFAARGQAVDAVWARGRKVVVDGRHVAAETTRQRFDATVAKLM
jgi:cytosine/adenosine deaminase-related metal-dependent hydrolase